MTKRKHKKIDVDRFTASLTKMQQKTDRTYEDDRKIQKVEADLAIASRAYEALNDALKTGLPQLFQLCGQIMDPCFRAFCGIQSEMMRSWEAGVMSFSNEPCISGTEILARYHQEKMDISVLQSSASSLRMIGMLLRCNSC